jgi:hypothetical protein
MKLPPNPTPLDLLMAGAEVPDLAVLPEYIAMAKEAGLRREKRIHDQEAAFADERRLTGTRGEVSALYAGLQEQLRKQWIPAWDELLDNPTACDTLLLSEQLRPLEYQLSFVKDAADRLQIRVDAARLRRLEATLERRKIESFESQLLYAISVLKTETAMAAIREDEGGAVVFGKRSIALRQASLEAMRQVDLAETALRDERNRQVTAEQIQLAQGTITRAAIASAIPARQG